jgi:hypothetical protein
MQYVDVSWKSQGLDFQEKPELKATTVSTVKPSD